MDPSLLCRCRLGPLGAPELQSRAIRLGEHVPGVSPELAEPLCLLETRAEVPMLKST